MPDIVDFKEVAVIEALVKPGDTVKPEQSLITVETDKASMEIPSSAGGVVAEIKVKIGDKVAEGSVVLSLETGADGKVQTIRFKNALIAAGSEAVKLPFLQTPQLRDDDRIVTSSGALELRQKPERMLVIGGGIIGPVHEAPVAAEVAAGDSKAQFDARVIPSVAYTDPEVA